MCTVFPVTAIVRTVSVLFSEPKIPQFATCHRSRLNCLSVSVLFSEPKIPQSKSRVTYALLFAFGFSALQRAENSSIHNIRTILNKITKFQCSSASRKFLNIDSVGDRVHHLDVSVLFSEPKIPQFISYPQRYNFDLCFSALQRAENSSILTGVCGVRGAISFQCSSASRKFLNITRVHALPNAKRCFSALQRAENSSIVVTPVMTPAAGAVSVLFSEPKIPQS